MKRAQILSGNGARSCKFFIIYKVHHPNVESVWLLTLSVCHLTIKKLNSVQISIKFYYENVVNLQVKCKRLCYRAKAVYIGHKIDTIDGFTSKSLFLEFSRRVTL